MKSKDIKQLTVTVIGANRGYKTTEDGTFSYTQYNTTVIDALYLGKNEYKKQIDYVQSLPYHSVEQIEAKKAMPSIMFGGKWELWHIHDEEIVEKTNLIVIDVDKKDNTVDLDKLRQKIFDLPYVFAVFKSASGKGLKAIVLVEDGYKCEEYYDYLIDLWKYKFDVVIDRQAKNIGRKCFVFIDDDMLIKDDDIDIKPWKLVKVELPVKETKKIDLFNKTDNDYMIERTHNAIVAVINDGYYADSYGAWYHLACELSNFSDGLDLFKQASHNHPKHNDKDSDITKKYNNAKPTGITDELHRKWQGLAKNRLGNKWWKMNLY